MKTILLIFFSIICLAAQSQLADTTNSIGVRYSLNCKDESIQEGSYIIFHQQENIIKQKITNQSFKLPYINLSSVDSITANINGKNMLLAFLKYENREENYEYIFKLIFPFSTLQVSYTNQIECIKVISNQNTNMDLSKIEYIYSWFYDTYCCEITTIKERK